MSILKEANFLAEKIFATPANIYNNGKRKWRHCVTNVYKYINKRIKVKKKKKTKQKSQRKSRESRQKSCQ